MLVESSVKFGSGSNAATVPLSQVIGNVQTAIGCGTLRREGGIAVQIIVGDPVCQGDVIETAVDGRIGIRFIDGSVFKLSGSTCVVLKEFICDSSGPLHSALFGISKGAFAIKAGKAANSGGLRVDTPFGSIRGRANAEGFGILLLTALTFWLMNEARAADPNAIFLDDDSITYKDFEHGAFELITKEAVPRHIIVDDPGVTVVLRPQGSTISVNQDSNSAARMAELRAAQQDALTTATKGMGSSGSSTPPFSESLSLQPINFNQTESSPAEQESLTPTPLLFVSVPEVIVGKIPPPPPTLNAVTGPTEIDTATFDIFSTESGIFVASSPTGAALSFGVGGGVAGSTVLGGVSYDISSTGPYGTLYIDSASGAYTFVPDSAAINALKAPTTTSFTITVSDGTLSANQTFTIAINGANDAAIISGSAAGSVGEAGGVGNAALGTMTASGTLTDTDVDDAPNAFTAVTSPTASAGGYGTFTITTAGVWTYTLNNANSAVQALNVGNTLTDSFTVTTVDGTAQVVTITISGSNDAAIISGTATGSVIEAGTASPGTPTATGTLIDTDVDNLPNTFAAVSSPTASANGYGTFTMTSAGVWTYTLNNANSAVQALNVGNTLTDSFTVTTVDGTAQVVTITISGSNDAAIISGTATGSVIEAGTASPGTPTATGTLIDTDVDNLPNTFAAVSSPTASANGYGTFTMTSAGVWTYTLNNANSAVQALDAGKTLTDTFTVTTTDGTAQVVTVTITGSNDAAVVSGTTTGTTIEAGGIANATPGIPTATGVLTDTDVDNAINAFTAVTSPTASASGYGTFTMTAAGVWTYTLNNTNSAVQALNVGNTLTDSFTVTTVDGTAQVVTITISGSNDAAVISGTATGSVIEAGTASPGTPTATGTLIDTDVDNLPNTFAAVSSPTASANGYGTFTMTSAGVWTYTLNNANSAVQALNVGNTLTDSFTVTTVDGTAQVVTITISGSNDAAVISGTATGSVIEAGTASPGTPTATGTLTDIDVDNPSNTFAPVSSPTASASGYGTFTMTAAGVWIYTLNNTNSAVQALDAGKTLTDTFTVATTDGTAQVVTITISGSNDAAVISGTTTGTAIEAGGIANATPGIPTATGVLTDTDVDNATNAFTAVTSPTASAGGYGTFTITSAGVWTYTLNNANSAVQALNVGNTLTDSFTVTTVDGTAQVVTITISGSNDAAIISGTASGSVIEAGTASPGVPTTTGTLTDTDVDDAPNTFTAVSSPTASASGYGTFTMTAAGVWIYTLDNANSAVQALNVGDTLADTFTVTTVDGTAVVISITINGASDADPNDFDHLATGTEVVTDPPFVFGTPGGDNIAGGGHDGQTAYAGASNDTVNGTGANDIIYSGSGNDTVKGNDGDDTIYGGSGSDTINGNNGGDTIIGGFGADQLTGSNGDDRFVYLSVADSNADQFDVISDFKSGSDRINLTALGGLGLAILALTSTSTSVPAHTIAWFYDSAANETIVYVNSTDHTLSIGDSGLLEIHLQGVATIQAADFIYEPTTASVVIASATIESALAATMEIDGTLLTTTTDVSSDSVVSDSALVADGSGTSSDEYFSFGPTQDRFDLIEHARLTSSDNVWTRSTEHTEGTVVAMTSGPPIELNRGQTAAPTEGNLTLAIGLDGAGGIKIGDGAVMPMNHPFGITAMNATAELHLVENGAVPLVGGKIVGSHSDSETGFIATLDKNDRSELNDHAKSKDNSEIPTYASSDHAADTHVNGPAATGAFSPGASHYFQVDSEHAAAVKLADVDQTPASIGHPNGGGGIVRSHSDGELITVDKRDHSDLKDHSESKNDSEILTKANSDHAAGTLALGDSFHFKDKISGSGRADVVKLADVDHTPASIGHPGGGGGIETHIDGETGFITLIDKKDHSELNDHSGSKTHSESVVMNAGPDNAAGTHVKSLEATGLFAIEQTFHFKDKISGSELLDVGLADLSHIPASVGHNGNSAGHHGPSAILMEVQTTELSLLEQDSAHPGRAVGIHSHDLMI